MIQDLRALAIFAETAETGSFRGAAKRLELSPSVVSYHISQLEKRLGAALIYRSTRKLTLTEEGRSLLGYARQMLVLANAGLAEVSGEKSQLMGSLKISLPTMLAHHAISEHIAEFGRQHPQLQLVLDYSDTRQDLIGSGVDLAIRAGELPDSALKARKLGQVSRRLLCASSLFTRFPSPTSPADLAQWPWIKLAQLPASRTLMSDEGDTQIVTFHSQLSVSSVDAMCQFCERGFGIATPPGFMMEKSLEAGKVVDVLPGWFITPISLYAIWPANATESSASRRLLQTLCDAPELFD